MCAVNPIDITVPSILQAYFKMETNDHGFILSRNVVYNIVDNSNDNTKYYEPFAFSFTNKSFTLVYVCNTYRDGRDMLYSRTQYLFLSNRKKFVFFFLLVFKPQRKIRTKRIWKKKKKNPLHHAYIKKLLVCFTISGIKTYIIV